MDTLSLQPLIQRFLEVQESDPLLDKQRKDHQRRKEAAQELLQLDRIPDLSREELEKFLKDTDNWHGVGWDREEFLAAFFGKANERLPRLREAMVNLVQCGEVGLSQMDFNELITVPGIGRAYLAEFLALRFPNQYWVWNSQVRNFFKKYEIDIKAELPWGKKGNEGEQYIAAGRHVTDVRRALSEAAGHPVDYLLTYRFICWTNRQETLIQPSDRWAERIAQWEREFVLPERIQVRQEGEARAHALLESKVGHFEEDDLRQFLRDLNADWYGGKVRHDRFMPALYGAQVHLMIETLDAFNLWTERLWYADDAELDALLGEFWPRPEVGGAGISLPTAILYLRDPEQYSIWLPVMSKGLEIAANFEPGKMRTARGYRRYNAALQGFREQYQLVAQATDVILWQAARSVKDEPGAVVFPGLTEDTFRFLQELAANNTEEWMQRDGEANKARYRRVLREPLRSLFEAVAPAVAEMNPAFETQCKFGKVLAGFRKRFPGEEGAYYPYLWGAFYRRGRSKQTDAQLFVIVHPDHVNVGFSVAGSQGSDVLTRFRHNLRQAPDLFIRLLQGLPQGVHVATAERHGVKDKKILTIQSVDDLQPLFETELIEIKTRYPANTPVLLESEFADEVQELFQALYPLFRFATVDDVQELASLVDVEVDAIDVPDGIYTLEQLCDDTFLEADFWQETELLIRDKKQIILYGPPGTGKTFVARQFARYWVDAASDPGGDVQVVQFHPSYAYEEFVEGIRPQSVEGPDGHRDLSYPVKKGVFQRFCDQARLHPHRRYMLILDEINRGELPRILGELLYLLEYRRESVVLPYSGEMFAIPSNLYLIGTMNTADRSIALVDHALRRRFHFVQMRSSSEVLRTYLEFKGDPEMAWTADLLEQLNHQLEQDGIEWHLHIGHSHLMKPDLDERRLRLIWKHSITPTLEEYFYRQPQQLQKYRLEALKGALGKS